MEDRRRERRYVATFPVAFETNTGWVFLTYSCNASRTGLLVMTAAVLEPGESVTINYRADGPASPAQQATGTIVRVEPNTGEDRERWPHLAAVEFPEGLPEMERLLAECGAEDEG